MYSGPTSDSSPFVCVTACLGSTAKVSSACPLFRTTEILHVSGRANQNVVRHFRGRYASQTHTKQKVP